MKRAVSLTILLFFLLGLTVCLNGCKKQLTQEPATIQPSETMEYSSFEELIEEQPSTDHNIESDRSNFYSTNNLSADLGGNLMINSSVNAPNNMSLSLPIVRVHSLTVDGEKVCHVLFPDRKIKSAQKYPNYPDAQSFELEGDRYVTVNTGTISATTPLGEVVTQLYALEWILNDKTLQHPDLSFASRDEVVSQTLTALSEMGINYVQCSEVYALSVDQLQSASDHLLSQPDFLEDIRGNRIAFKQNWSVDDECYVLNMKFLIGDYNIPVFSDDSMKTYALTEIHYENYMLEAVVSKDGIISLRVFRAFKEIQQGNVGKIIPVEDVVNLISEYYQNIIVEYPTVIDRIDLNYILLPVEGKNTYELRPAWCCHVISQYGSKDEYKTSWIVFDAVTRKVHY